MEHTVREIGIAFDLGTTTIAAASVDPGTGQVIEAMTSPNPQARWGKDVLSRINSALEGSLDELRASVVEAFNGMIQTLSRGAAVREITVAGNTVMEHLFLGVSPEPLSRVPYKPAFKEARRTGCKELGLVAKGDPSVYVFPIIGGFVGGDAVAVGHFLCMGEGVGATLAVDIGTNSEILLCSGGSVYATSAAAGPAFEGGEIKYGMTASKGAIQGVRVEGERVVIDVIGSPAPATGICGSGLIDGVSNLVKAGLIERSGRIRSRGEVESNLANRISEDENGNSIILYKGAKGEVALTQADIRALQSAKSAIKAGISILLMKAGIAPAQVERVFIAGAFGSNIKKDGLETIGILDPVWDDRVSFVGDAALLGAALAVRADDRAQIEALASRAKYVSLSGSAHFQREFIKNMDF